MHMVLKSFRLVHAGAEPMARNGPAAAGADPVNRQGPGKSRRLQPSHGCRPRSASRVGGQGIDRCAVLGLPKLLSAA